MHMRETGIAILLILSFLAFQAKGEETTPYREEQPAQAEEKAGPSAKSPCMPPKITYLVTDYGKPGDTIHIKGRRFGLNKGTVTFNGVPAEILTWRMETIYVKVPEDAITGPIIVNNGCSNSNGKVFTVGPPPPKEEQRGTTWPW